MAAVGDDSDGIVSSRLDWQKPLLQPHLSSWCGAKLAWVVDQVSLGFAGEMASFYGKNPLAHARGHLGFGVVGSLVAMVECGAV